MIAKLLWSNDALELWRTDSDYRATKFHIFKDGKHFMSTFNGQAALENVRLLRKLATRSDGYAK